MDTLLRDGINWVGYVDWTVRDFHGYRTERGSTYNSYLVEDEKIALIDTVKASYVERLLDNISTRVKLEDVSYVVCNHAEPDHSGGLARVMAACSNAELVCDEKCLKVLSSYHDASAWKVRIVKDGDSISLGKRTLAFLETPMVHWPESMFTYIPEEKLLFSMDAFGQHYASAHRFDDQESIEVIMQEAKTYYANIVMLYGKQIAKLLGRAADIEIEMVAPSHGVIWRSQIGTILAAYKEWSQCKVRPKVLVIYDTMWQSTEKMAQAILAGASRPGIDTKLLNVRASNSTVIATEVLDAAAIAVGSPTLNMTIMPKVVEILAYLKGLRPAGKAGFAFGSYGWGQNGPKEVDTYLQAMKFEMLRDPLCAKFVPTAETLEECRKAGELLADKAAGR